MDSYTIEEIESSLMAQEARFEKNKKALDFALSANFRDKVIWRSGKVITLEVKDKDKILVKGSMGIKVEILVKVLIRIMVVINFSRGEFNGDFNKVEALTMVLMDKAKIEDVGIQMVNHNASCMGSLGMWF